MTLEQKKDIIMEICDILDELLVATDNNAEHSKMKIHIREEMLTIKECANELDDVSEYRVRKLVYGGKIPYVRMGEEQNSKILVRKSDVIDFLGINRTKKH